MWVCLIRQELIRQIYNDYEFWEIQVLAIKLKNSTIKYTSIDKTIYIEILPKSIQQIG